MPDDRPRCPATYLGFRCWKKVQDDGSPHTADHVTWDDSGKIRKWTTPPKKVVSPVTRPDESFTGDACSECFSMSVVRTGTCGTCQNCGATTGCG